MAILMVLFQHAFQLLPFPITQVSHIITHIFLFFIIITLIIIIKFIHFAQSDNVPPTIMFGLPAGSAAIEPSGVLAVFPGSILHLECLFSRKLGNPEWTWTSAFRQHLTG